MKKIAFWSPHLTHVATIGNVLKSAISLNKFRGSKFKTIFLDAAGEWSFLKKDFIYKNIEYSKVSNLNFLESRNINGYFYSRFCYFIIFIFNFIPLLKFLKKNKLDYLIVHLITSLPIILFSVFNFKTKLILRISGLPKLNFIRSNFWKLLGKYIYHVTCATKETRSRLIDLKIFPENKISVVEDPIINVTEISRLKKHKEIADINDLPNNYLLSVGRLSKQKNHILAINAICKLKDKLPNINLCIVGDGELKNYLQKIIFEKKLENNIFLLGYKKNVFPFILNAEAVISTSLWEDPGAVMIESAFLNKVVIVSDCPSGPKEFVENSIAGYLFRNNDAESLVSAILKFKNENSKSLFMKKYIAKKKTKKYTLFNHFKKIEKILS